MAKICVQCGREFVPRHFNQTLCSDICKRRRNTERDGQYYRRLKGLAVSMRHSMRHCVVCDREFTPNAPNQLTCSPECRTKFKAKRRRQYYLKHEAPTEPYSEKKICVICGKEFDAYRPTSKACSPECALEVKRRGTRDWKARHAERIRKYKREFYHRHHPKPQPKPKLDAQSKAKRMEKKYLKYLARLEKTYGQLSSGVPRRLILTWSDNYEVEYPDGEERTNGNGKELQHEPQTP